MCSPTPVRVVVPTHGCEGRDIYIVHSCMALFVSMFLSVSRCRYRHGHDGARSARHSSVALLQDNGSCCSPVNREIAPGIAGVVLSPRTVSRAHVRRDAAIQPPLQKLPIAIGCIGCDGGWLSSWSLDKADDYVLCSDRLLTQAGGCRWYTHDHATGIVHQIVVVVAQPGRRLGSSNAVSPT